MNFKENIKYYEMLNHKVIIGEKLTAKEKEWFSLNPMFNPLYDEEAYQKDVIELIPNQQYSISITLENTCFQSAAEMYPVICGITKKDGIILDEQYEVTDINGNIKKGPVRMLALLNIREYSKQSLVYKCESGRLGVKYGCEYFDPKMKLYRRESSECHYGYAMKKEIISNSMIRYTCKHPLAEKYDFLGFSFVIEYNKY